MTHLGFTGDDQALARALAAGHPGAPAALFDRHAAHVQRVLASVLGIDAELPDLLHDVFAEALRCIEKLDDGARLKAWLTSIAVFTARGCIRSRRRRRWLRFFAPTTLPEEAAPDPPHEAREAMRATYAVLEELPAELRLAFALRYIQGLKLTEVAEACGASLATIKRRLNRAERQFARCAEDHPALQPWLAGSRFADGARP